MSEWSRSSRTGGYVPLRNHPPHTHLTPGFAGGARRAARKAANIMPNTPLVAFAIWTPAAKQRRDRRRRTVAGITAATLLALPSPVRLAIESMHTPAGTHVGGVSHRINPTTGAPVAPTPSRDGSF